MGFFFEDMAEVRTCSLLYRPRAPSRLSDALRKAKSDY